MVSLSTVYGLTIVLGTLAAIGSAFVGTKVYPIQAGGTIEMALAPAAAIIPAVTAALKSATPAPKEEPLKTEVTSTIEEAPKTEEAPIAEPSVQEELPVTEEASSVGGRKVPRWFRKH